MNLTVGVYTCLFTKEITVLLFGIYIANIALLCLKIIFNSFGGKLVAIILKHRSAFNFMSYSIFGALGINYV